MIVAHLASSSFFGGPERQMLGLARAISPKQRSVFLAFAEGGRCQGLLREVERFGFEAIRLKHNYPGIPRVIGEIAAELKRINASILCCHGYKADLLGLAAARRARVPVISVSHGWTGATWKVRLNEAADRFCLRWMDAVVAVSAAQASKLLQAGVSLQRTVIIHNAVDITRFGSRTPLSPSPLQKMFSTPRSAIVLAIGRLSKEKGFSDLVDAAAIVARTKANIGFVIAGDGPLRQSLSDQIRMRGLQKNFVLAGFRNDIERLLPCADILAISSYTEGLPTVLLEAFAAGVPVVATPVGGIPEVVQDGINGFLSPVHNPDAMAAHICMLLCNPSLHAKLGQQGRQIVQDGFTFDAQKQKYLELFESVRNPTEVIAPGSLALRKNIHSLSQAAGGGGAP